MAASPLAEQWSIGSSSSGSLVVNYSASECQPMRGEELIYQRQQARRVLTRHPGEFAILADGDVTVDCGVWQSRSPCVVNVVVHDRGWNTAAVHEIEQVLVCLRAQGEHDLHLWPLDLLQLIVQPHEAGVMVAVAAHVNGAAAGVLETDEWTDACSRDDDFPNTGTQGLGECHLIVA